MRLSLAWITVGSGLAACAIPLLVGAQQPPVLEKLEEGEPPAVTIRKPDTEKQITEKRQQGKVTEVKVKSGKSTYYLKPVSPAGSALRGEGQSDEIRAAQWPVLEFDMGAKKKKTTASEAEAAAAAEAVKNANTAKPNAKPQPAAEPAEPAK
ncbi:DUF2782 domain-containing protein [Herminiimonas sp. CN]|uniref:DUF2782 domain-containing protein n=1 Tax=Herminiimonas sp. CN TaxID=1349818 RepID=UPI0006884D7E|nr:DUF2782 domain-containing protein [Herminiimonas sp. CN]